MAQKLLDGALQKTSVDAAVRKIYDNMFQKTGWKYNASVPEVSGARFISGAKTAGMCEGYRNAFAEILNIYDQLRASHPDDRVKNGTLKIERGDALAKEKFVTRKGLTLMGETALKGNVYLQVDGSGNVLDQGLDSLKTFVFYGHWTLKVNGKEYDPIFHSIDKDNVAEILDQNYSDEAGKGRFVPDKSKPIRTGEFGSTFVHVTDWVTFHDIVKDVEQLEQAKRKDIDALLSGSTAKLWGRSIFRPKHSRAYKDAADIFQRRIQDRATFAQVVEAAYGTDKITRAQKKAFDKLSPLFPFIQPPGGLTTSNDSDEVV